jgi:hypothetical protein
MKNYAFIFALSVGVTVALLQKPLTAANQGAHYEGGVVYSETDQRIKFKDNNTNTRSTVTELDEDYGLDATQLKQQWYYVDYRDGTQTVWAEYLRYEDKGSFSTPNKFFGLINFSGDVTSNYELRIWQVVFYQPTEYGEIGFGVTSLNQELSFAGSVGRASEEFEVIMPNIRWRNSGDLSESFYYHLEAAYMTWLEDVDGYDGMIEIGYRQYLGQNKRKVSDYFKVGVGYRIFEVDGEVDHSDLDLNLKGGFVRVGLGTSF